MSDKPPPYNPKYQPMEPPPPYTPEVQVFTPGTTTGSTTYVTQQPAPNNYGTIPVVIQPVQPSNIIVVGGCPACRVGVLNEEFTLAGLCCAFWFFPLGILCCLAMREKRCTNCGATFC